MIKIKLSTIKAYPSTYYTGMEVRGWTVTTYKDCRGGVYEFINGEKPDPAKFEVESQNY